MLALELAPPMRQFPPPWTVEALDGGFKIVDANGRALAYVYGRIDKRDAEIAKSLTLDEARRMGRSSLESHSATGGHASGTMQSLTD